MNIILKNITDNSTQNINMKEILNVSNFIEKIYVNLDKLDSKNYYCILFKHKNNYEKVIKAKLGYIYNDINNISEIILTSDENYLQYTIDKYSLKDLEIECIKCVGVPQKISIIIEREQIAMGDSGPYSEKEVFSPEIKLTKLLRTLPYSNIYKVIEMVYTNLDGKEENLVITNNVELVNGDISLSEFVEINNINVTKDIILKLMKYKQG